ncbi:MAG: HD family phosphohydrolase [bacterium]
MFGIGNKSAGKAVSAKKIPLKDKKILVSRYYKNYTLHFGGLLLVLTIALTYLISPIVSVPHISMQAGDISPKDIKAPRDLQVEDKATTIKRQQEAEAKVLAVYDFDDRLLVDINQKLSLIFRLLKEDQKALFPEQEGTGTNSTGKEGSPESNSPEAGLSEPLRSDYEESSKSLSDSPQEASSLVLTAEQRWERFKQKTSLPLSFEEYEYLLNWPEKGTFRGSIYHLLSVVMQKGIVGSLNLPLEEIKKGFIKRNITTGEEVVMKGIDEVFDEERAKREIQTMSSSFFPENPKISQLAATVAKGLIYPNINLNLSETRLRRMQAIESVKPSFFQIKKGEMIIREGERITENHLTKLYELMKVTEEENVYLSFLGLGIIVLLTLIMLLFFIDRVHPTLARNMKNLLLIASIILITMFLNKIFVYIAHGLSATVSQIEYGSYFYSFPFAAAAMLVALLLDAQIAVMVAAAIAIFSGLLLGKDFYFFLLAFFSGLGAIYGLVYKAHRTAVVRSGAMVSLANLAVIIPLDMTKGALFSSQGAYDCLFGIIGGLIVATLVSVLLPIFESLFKLTTDIKLLELLNMNQPILRRLATEAPGTYHHSVIVGNLSEAACEAIGANSLLARVASNYHDIGKIKKPRYFVENQMNFKNEHEKLSPSMSGLILISHVKDGVELARQHKLTPTLVDIISQHHGTSLQKFFYKKAKDQEEREGQKIYIVKEDDYRYPGPKPQTKEAGIIMLADAVEAASRTLTEPSPSRIKGLILTIINDIFRDGQLDDCELTLKDLHQIAGSFNRILTGIFHQRIAYPSLESGAENGKKNGDPNQKSAKDPKGKYPQMEEDNEENLRRLGISSSGSEHSLRNR